MALATMVADAHLPFPEGASPMANLVPQPTVKPIQPVKVEPPEPPKPPKPPSPAKPNRPPAPPKAPQPPKVPKVGSMILTSRIFYQRRENPNALQQGQLDRPNPNALPPFDIEDE